MERTGLTLRVIRDELDKLALAYPQARRSEVDLDVLAGMWVEDLDDLTERNFLDAVKAHRRRSKFFPSAADIIERHEEQARNPEPSRLALPETPCRMSDDDLARNRKGARAILDMLAAKAEPEGVEGPRIGRNQRERLRRESLEREQMERGD